MMNKKIPLLLFALALSLAPARAFVTDTGYELQAEGDFDGNGRIDVIILDKASGGYRIGYQTALDVYTWVPARASGITPATGLGIGKLNSLVFDSLAVTGPDANRVNILNANNTSVAGLPEWVFPPSVGPNLSAVIDIGGPGNTTHADLYVASIYNGASPFRQTLLRNDATTNRTLISDSALSYARDRGNPALLHTNRPARLALFDRGVNPTFDVFTILDLTSSVPATVTAVATSVTPAPYEYVTGQFAPGNPYTQFLLYPPGGFYFFTYQIIEPAPGAYTLSYTNQYTFSNTVQRIFVLPGTNDTRLLVLDTNGVSAVVYKFDGTNAPVVVQQFAAAPGEHFTGAGALGRSGFMAYSAPLGENTSTKFKQYNWNGSTYNNTASGDLPRVNPYIASGNVMQFRLEPFVNPNPVLLRVNNAGDWSSRPQISGGNISARTETFLNSTQGLVNPSPLALGAAHPLAAFGLANQYSNMISLFSFNPPAGDKVSEVSISPPGGVYPAAVHLKFTSVNPTDTIKFRIGAGGWQTWSVSLDVPVFSNSVVQYYGQPAGNVAKSAIKTASYTFTSPAGQLDSDADGVPDFVEVGRGLNPNGGRDSDGDGYSDLEELIRNTNPLLKASAPTNFPHIDERSAFDLTVTPLPFDGFSNAVTLSATGTVIRAYDLHGSLYNSAITTNPPRPFARITNLPVIVENRLMVHATELHYNILTTNVDKTVGREMLALTAVPDIGLPSIPYIYGGSNLLSEANNWVLSASNILKSLPRTIVTNALTMNDTLEALLFETKIAQLFQARGSNWWTNITLFPHRISDFTRTNPPQSLLLSLEYKTDTQPGYRLQGIHSAISNLVQNSGAAGIVALRNVVRDIYRIDSLLNNTNPATFVSPVDEIRHFLWSGTFDSNYLAWATTSGQFASATAGAVSILAAVSPRPTTNVLLAVRPDTFGGACRILDVYGGAATFALQDFTGLPLGFPDAFNLLPGSLIEISGYTDVAGCGYPGIEVTTALLCSVPIATDTDADGNLLIDTWEKKFYGYLDLADPFADSDGDTYSNLQEMLEGSDPADFFGRPLVPRETFAAPVLSLDADGGLVELHFQWPATYINKFNFGVRHTDALATPFINLVATGPIHVAGNEFKMTFAAPGTQQHYYYLTVALQ